MLTLFLTDLSLERPLTFAIYSPGKYWRSPEDCVLSSFWFWTGESLFKNTMHVIFLQNFYTIGLKVENSEFSCWPPPGSSHLAIL